MRFWMLIACFCSTSFGVTLGEPQAAERAPKSLAGSVTSKRAPEVLPVLGQGALGLSQQQALRQLREHGFVVTRLAQDNEGIWLGEATHRNVLVDIAVDTAGNVITWQ